MKLVYFPSIVFLILAPSTGCEKKIVYEADVYVGAYRIIDQTIPYPFFIVKSSQSISLADHTGNILDSGTNDNPSYVKEDTIKMKKHKFKILYVRDSCMNVFDLDNKIDFPIDSTGQMYWKNRATFVKAISTPKYNVKDVKDKLTGKVFRGESLSENPNDDLKVIKYLHFTSDSIKTDIMYVYQNEAVWHETQTRKISLTEINHKVFFSANEDDQNPRTIYQLTDLDKDAFSIRYFYNEYDRTEVYKLVIDASLSKSNMWKKYGHCFDGHQGEYYYQSIAGRDVTYKKGNEFILNQVKKNAPMDAGNGYIILHFTVNCLGQTGRIGLQQMDNNFKKTSFGIPLVKHFIHEVMNLKEWPATESGYDFIFYKDVHAFLMFKIENGQITDLCP